MKKIILLLAVVALCIFGFLWLRERPLQAGRQGAALQPGNVARSGGLPDRQDLSFRRPPAGRLAARAGATGTAGASRQARPAQARRPLGQPPLALPLSRKKELTPAEMLQWEKQRKRERRRNGYAKSDQPDKYAAFHRLIRTREGDAAPRYTADFKLRELRAARQLAAAGQARARTQALPWSERGPANVPGRTRGLLTHPDEPGRIWWAGSVAGGIWKTTDAGANWVNKTPDLPNLATTTLAMAPSQPDILYAGTGESFVDYLGGVNGDGMFKSLDGGETWHQLSATAGRIEFRNINRIIVDPQDANVLLICSSAGFYDDKRVDDNVSWIMRSTDGGASWSTVHALPDRIQQLVASPDNFQVQYGTVQNRGVIKSTDGGRTWALSSQGLYPGGRIELAVSPTRPARLYAAAEGSLSSASGGSLGSDLYLSDDAGRSWTLVWEADDQANINWLGSQGWYDNTLAVHPYDEDIVYVGGINLWKMSITNRTGRTPQKLVTHVEEINTQTFLNFVDFGAQAFGGKLDLGNIPEADRVSVEIRFGPGQAQKAHRFTVDGRGAGVPPQDYRYQDYVEVPFQVWDVTNNRQLMVSFRDQQEDGQFNLLPNADTLVERREYLFIHATRYDTIPHTSIARNGGHEYRNMYFLWPELPQGAAWEPDQLPASKVVIHVEQLPTRLRQTQNLTDSYGEYEGKNAYVHVDHHNLILIREEEQAGTFKILDANDGGVYVSRTGTDPGNAQNDWIFAGNGYNTTQFYGVDKKRGANEYIGGTQDNGTWRSPSLEQASAATSYLFQLGGDGFEASWNYFDPNRLIGTVYYNFVYRSLNGGETWSEATTGLADQGPGAAPFVTQIATSRSNPDVLYTTGVSGVWVSDDFGESWKLSPVRAWWDFNGLVSDVKVSEANTQIIWAGQSISSNGRLHVSTDGGQTFNATSGYEQTTLGRISGLATHPLEDSTAYALFSFSDTPKILRTTDLGRSWTDISGFGTNASSSTGFPDVAVYSLVVMPHDPDIIWVGTEIGLVESTDGGATWSLARNGLPAVSVWELKVVDDQVVAATHGRGIFSVTLPELDRPVVFVPYIQGLRVGFNRKLIVNASLRSPYDSTLVLVNDTVAARLGATAVQDTVLQIAHSREELLAVQLRSYRDGKPYVSQVKTIDFFLVTPAHTYSNNFDQPSQDFLGDDFSIRLVPGFSDGAIHSPHPYRENFDYTYQLKIPIIVAENNAFVRYQDVALVEPGIPGFPFGSPWFFDYVVVEGSKDGLAWTPLADGYDASFHASWLDAYGRGLPGHDSLFVAHSLDLHQAFAPGDTVFLRFRLFSDPIETGWGWAIDDLSIQEEFLAIESFSLVNAATGAELGPMADQDTLNLNRTGRQLNIRANTFPETVGSVVFQLNQAVFGIDNQPPYALAGDTAGQYQGWTPEEGTYTLIATPYPEADGQGRPGQPLRLTFTVVKANEVISFVLVNAETGADIRTLQPGEVIDLSQVGRKLNIRASTLPILVGSVVFTYDGHSRTENFPPYALGGFNYLRLRYNTWTPAVGSHTLKATPYSRLQAKGHAGISHQLVFRVVDADATAAEPDSLAAGQVLAFPNPTSGKVSLDLGTRQRLDVTLQVYNLKGIQVHQQQAALQPGSNTVEMDLSALPDGLYLIKANADGQKFNSFNIIKSR